MTLTMAASNYLTGELLDRFGVSPRWVTVGIGLFFVLPGIAWFLTQRWWDREQVQPARDKIDERKDLSVIHHSIE
jgi:MFS family permease